MTGKVKTYVLSIVVIVVWAIIGFQIYSTLNPLEEISGKIKLKKPNRKRAIEKRDTFAIINNYRDPFLAKRTEKKDVESFNPSPSRPKDSIVFPDIVYKGLVQSSSGKSKIFALSIDGTDQLLSNGGIFGSVKVLSGSEESITILFKGKKRTIVK